MIPSITTTTTNSNHNIQVGLQTAIIKPGETYILPAGAIVQSLIYDGSIDVTSTCDNLPSPDSYKCYNFIFTVNRDITPSPTLEGQDTILNYLEISGIKYNSNMTLNVGTPSLHLDSTVKANLTTFFSTSPPQAIFKLNHIDTDLTGDRATFIVYFKSIDSIASTIKLKFTGNAGFENGLFVTPSLAQGYCT